MDTLEEELEINKSTFLRLVKEADLIILVKGSKKIALGKDMQTIIIDALENKVH